MTRLRKVPLILAGIILLLVLGNIIVLDYKFFVQKENLPEKQVVFVERGSQSVATGSSDTSSTAVGITREEVEDIVHTATASINVNANTSTTNLVPQSTGQREFVITLGSGESTAKEWTDVTGVEAYIDNTKYGRIKSAVFEASLYTPTGNQTAYVRLYNVSDKNMVWPSELSIEGGEPKLLISTPLGLGSGNKLYRVQMKTQLGARTQLIQARVKITTE